MEVTHGFVMNKLFIRLIIRQENKKSPEKGWINLKAFVNSHKVLISLGMPCPVENWDSDTERIKYVKGGELSKERVTQWNDILIRMQDRANDLRHHYDMMNQVLTPEMFKRDMKDDTRHQDFLSFVEKQIAVLAQRWAKGTVSHYRVTLDKLKEVQPIIRFADLNENLLIRFESLLKKKKLAVNTIWRHHKDVRMFINEAIKSGVRIKNPYEDYKIIKAKANRCYLSGDEIIRLRDLMLSGKLHPSHEMVLKYFIFSCYTGLRISDVMAITHEDIVDRQLIFLPKKTKRFHKIIRLPLTETSLWLIGQGSGPIFKTFAEQVTNRYLKEIASIAGIKKSISFHVARHTFAMRFLEKGGKVEVLKDILGHSDIDTTMEYVHDLNHMAKHQMQLMED